METKIALVSGNLSTSCRILIDDTFKLTYTAIERKRERERERERVANKLTVQFLRKVDFRLTLKT